MKSKTFLSQTADFSYNLPSNCFLDSIQIRATLPSSSIQVGTTLEGNELIETNFFTEMIDFYTFKIETPYQNAISLFFTIFAGTFDVKINYKENYIWA